VLGSTGQCWAVLGSTRQCWAVLGRYYSQGCSGWLQYINEKIPLRFYHNSLCLPNALFDQGILILKNPIKILVDLQLHEPPSSKNVPTL